MTPYHVVPVCAILLAYLFGSISSAVIVSRLMGLPDPRTQGSNNPGATNVLRIGGKKAAIITLLGDILKGTLPVLIARGLGLDTTTIALVTLAAFLGHLYPVFFGFKGGKGVATAFGCLFALNWPLGIVLSVTWALIAFLFRYSSLASLTTACLAPLYTWYFTNTPYTLAVIFITALLIYRHRNNIHKLLHGEESKIGKK